MPDDKTHALHVVFSCPSTGLMTFCVNGDGSPPEPTDPLRLGPFRSLSFDSGGSLYGVPLHHKSGTSLVAIADPVNNLGGWSVEQRWLGHSATNIYRLIQIETLPIDLP